MGPVLPLVLQLVLGQSLRSPRSRWSDTGSILHRVISLQYENSLNLLPRFNVLSSVQSKLAKIKKKKKSSKPVLLTTNSFTMSSLVRAPGFCEEIIEQVTTMLEIPFTFAFYEHIFTAHKLRSVRKNPRMVKSGRYASYWNAFLLCTKLPANSKP